MDVAEMKQRARATWSAGDYDAMVDKIWEAGAVTVGSAGVTDRDDVLDVACGTGNAAIRAAEAGGQVVGLDLTPELFDGARRRAGEAGVEVKWVEGDAEALPFDDATFDVVTSTFGCMFAPRHDVAAAEIARVLRPGGRIAIASWTPEGLVGTFFRTVSGHMPPPPEGFQPPPLWGTPDHVSALFEGSGIELRFERKVQVMGFASIDEAVEMYASKFGPMVMAKAALEPEGKWDALAEDLRAIWAESNKSDGDDLVLDSEYLLVSGTKAA